MRSEESRKYPPSIRSATSFKDDCAVLKAFRGASENEFLSYLIIITRSVVKEAFRRQHAQKRPVEDNSIMSESSESICFESRGGRMQEEPAAESHLLADELWFFGMRALRNMSGPFYARDRAIVELHFMQGMSVNEIARLERIGLSKTAVEDVIKRFKDHVRRVAQAEGAWFPHEPHSTSMSYRAPTRGRRSLRA